MMPRIRLSFVVLLFSLPVFAQMPVPRFTGPISDANKTVLAHSRTPRVRAGQDLGPVEPDILIPGITLVFRRSADQEAALQQLLTEQQTRGSRFYHQWLTPDTFAARFGVADSDITTTENWLSSQGFRIDNVARSRDRITFSGTAKQVQATFGAALHHYKVDGELHMAPAADLSLPAKLTPAVGAILHLSDFRPKPNWKIPARGDYTDYPSGNHYLTPADINTMYQASIPPTLNIGDAGIAVAGQSYVNTGTSSSLASFGNSGPSQVLVPGSGVEAVFYGDEGESEIDLEYSSAIVGRPVYFVFVGDNANYSVFDAIAYAIAEDIAPVVSVSYGSCEPALSSTELDQNNALYEEAAAQGQTLIASAGDSGSTSCAPYTTADGVSVAEQQELAVNFPASSPYFVAVGGTQMAAGTFAASNTTYWLPQNEPFTPTASLLSYVPEVPWNEGSAVYGIQAGGGGPSSYFPRPAWQSSFPGMPAGSYRMLPDIALQSSVQSPGYVLCTDDPTIYFAEGQTASCANGLDGSNGAVTVAGGTSFAAPIFAGYIALLNQATGSMGQGNINPVLYGLASNAGTYASVFHDITSGSTGCVTGATNCTPTAESSYAAGTGYDLATGLGSLNIGALAAAWPAAANANLQVPAVEVEINTYTAAPGESVPLQIYVGTTAGDINQTAPTGNVAVLVDGTVVNPALALTPGAAYDNNALATYNVVAPSVAGGHVFTVNYLGDATHAKATGNLSLIVGDVLASGGLTLSAGNVTVNNGSSASTTVTITPNGGYSGAVMWSLSVAGASATSITGCYSIAPVRVSGATTDQLTIGTGAACTSAKANAQKLFRVVANRAAAEDLPGLTAMGAVYTGLLFGGSFVSRRRKRSCCWVVLLLLTAASGCGGSGGGQSATGPSNPAPVTSTLTATLTGADSVNGLITASTTFTITVDGQ